MPGRHESEPVHALKRFSLLACAALLFGPRDDPGLTPRRAGALHRLAGCHGATGQSKCHVAHGLLARCSSATAGGARGCRGCRETTETLQSARVVRFPRLELPDLFVERPATCADRCGIALKLGRHAEHTGPDASLRGATQRSGPLLDRPLARRESAVLGIDALLRRIERVTLLPKSRGVDARLPGERPRVDAERATDGRPPGRRLRLTKLAHGLRCGLDRAGVLPKRGVLNRRRLRAAGELLGHPRRSVANREQDTGKPEPGQEVGRPHDERHRLAGAFGCDLCHVQRLRDGRNLRL